MGKEDISTELGTLARKYGINSFPGNTRSYGINSKLISQEDQYQARARLTAEVLATATDPDQAVTDLAQVYRIYDGLSRPINFSFLPSTLRHPQKSLLSLLALQDSIAGQHVRRNLMLSDYFGSIRQKFSDEDLLKIRSRKKIYPLCSDHDMYNQKVIESKTPFLTPFEEESPKLKYHEPRKPRK